jgi:hypothetical protein
LYVHATRKHTKAAAAAAALQVQTTVERTCGTAAGQRNDLARAEQEMQRALEAMGEETH